MHGRSRTTKQTARLGPAALLLLSGLASGGEAEAQSRRTSTRGNFGESLPAPGLSVIFADGAACTPIASPYGSSTRYDGSLRKTGGAEGAHGGIDLTLPEGTPLLAMAPGRVMAGGAGGQMEGNFLWIVHLTEATGLGFPFLAKYQHLSEVPALRAGDKVRIGQEIGRSGKTGTVGGHYGTQGYAHLHLTVRLLSAEAAERARVTDGEIRILRDSTQIDPLTIYVPGLQSPADAASLPPDRKVIRIAHVDSASRRHPADARAVWPVACR